MNSFANTDNGSVGISVVNKRVDAMGKSKVSQAARAEAVRKVIVDGATKAAVAEELNVTENAVTKWLRDHKMVAEKDAEVKRIKDYVSKLELEKKSYIEEHRRLESKLEAQKELLVDILRER